MEVSMFKLQLRGGSGVPQVVVDVNHDDLKWATDSASRTLAQMHPVYYNADMYTEAGILVASLSSSVQVEVETH
jgi:hypothetical protein